MEIRFKVTMHGSMCIGRFSVGNRDHQLEFYVLNNGTVSVMDVNDDTINSEQISHELREREVFQLPEGLQYRGIKYEYCRNLKNEITAVRVFLIEIQEGE